LNRIGSTSTITVDVRVLAATNKDLGAMTGEGKFREDLFYRINIVQIKVPPLRERREDIKVLAEHFLQKFSTEKGLRKIDFSSEAMTSILSYDWPGNVRELENAIERAVVMGDGKRIMADDLPIRKAAIELEQGITVGMTLKDAQDVFRKEFVRKTLAHTRGNRKKAAEIMGIQRTYISKLINEFNLEL
jgi:Nif-specific regulatory protein